jgi:hypothetical protein
VNDADRRAACTLASAALAMDGAADLRGVLEVATSSPAAMPPPPPSHPGPKNFHRSARARPPPADTPDESSAVMTSQVTTSIHDFAVSLPPELIAELIAVFQIMSLSGSTLALPATAIDPPVIEIVPIAIYL